MVELPTSNFMVEESTATMGNCMSKFVLEVKTV
jgi:hypothetical protein